MSVTSASSPSPDASDADIKTQRLRFVLPLLLLSLLIGVLGIFAYRSLADEIRRETHRTLTVIAEQKRLRIQDLLDEIRTDARTNFGEHSRLESLFKQWEFSERTDQQVLREITILTQEGVRVKGWQGMALVNHVGQTALVIGDVDLSEHQALIQDVLQRPRMELVDLHRTHNGMTQFGVLTPIGSSERGIVGVAYLSWSANEALYPLVSAWPVPTRTAETYLVRRQGDDVQFVSPLRHRHHAELNITEPLNKTSLAAGHAAKGERGILFGMRDYRHVPVLAYAAGIDGAPWLMLAEIDEREAYAGIRNMTWATAIVIGLGLLLVYSVAFHTWRRSRERQAMQTLQAKQLAESRFRVIFEEAPLGVALVDSQTGIVQEANRRLCEIIGVPAEQLIGAHTSVYTHEDDREASQRHIDALKTGNMASHTYTKRYVRPDGEVVWASVTGAPIQVDASEAPRHLFIVEDISDRKRYERELREASEAAEAANAAKSEFLAHMSHEIRTPMNAVLGLAQVLEREPLPDHQRDMVKRIRTAGQSLLTILNDVLDLSKIEAGQFRLEPRPFDVPTLLASLDSLMGQMARAKGLALRIEAPHQATLGPLLGDGLRIEQVLFNLTGNAIKFTERGEVVVRVNVVSATPDSVRLRFDISDTGIGISRDAMPRLFAPFTQADGGITRRFGGTGLGLSICKRLVELMNGEIGANSIEGHGSTFWIELPMPRASAEAYAAASQPAPTLPSGPRLSGAHVLVVDDSAMNRDLVERALRLEGATATLAADGQQALQILSTRPTHFHAVLMDVQMPVMDGLTATRLIREELRFQDLPIIAFTAGVRSDQQEAARTAGANDVLPKPMDLDQMALVLAKWIRLPDTPAVPGSTPAAQPALDTPCDEFPDIEGIDSKRAAQRLGNDRDMFLDLLNMFAREYRDAVTQTRQELAQGDRSSAARRMHTLRSSAGFLCALDVMDAAGDVEDAIDAHDNAPTEVLERLLHALERELQQLLQASTPWINPI